jgi:hypothetical protein
VDADLSKFFDTVDQDVLMRRVAKKVHDKRVLRLIGKYLRAGVVINGRLEATRKGVPQGGPLSPLLANILLDDLDKELEARGHRFARYADDCAPRRRIRVQIMTLLQPCCIKDEGRPLGAVMQVKASNHLKLLWSKAMVVSVKEKARHDLVR